MNAEREREDRVRQVSCPLCAARPGRPCWWPRRADGSGCPTTFAHTARYRIAFARGLVPALPGWGQDETPIRSGITNPRWQEM